MIDDKNPATKLELRVASHLQAIAKDLKTILRDIADGEGELGFALTVFEFGKTGRSQYVSSAERDDMKHMFESLLEHWDNSESHEWRAPKNIS